MDLLIPDFGIALWEVFILALVLFWIFAIVDILRSDYKGHNDKLIWILVILFIPLIGIFLYWGIGRRNRIPTTNYTIAHGIF